MEAAYFNNYLISTDVGAARDLIDLTKHGIIVESTINGFSTAIYDYILAEETKTSFGFDRTILHWENLVKSKMIDNWIIIR